MIENGFETIEDIIDEANSNLQFEITTKLSVSHLEGSLRELLESQAIKAEIVNVGSTNTRRFTAVSEIMDPWKRFEPDIDIYVITQERLSEFAVQNVCDRLQVPGLMIYDHKMPTYYCSVNGIPAEISFIPKTEEQKHAPLQYHRLGIPLDSKQVAEIKGLTLFLKRGGLYGGWNSGIKRLAAEQLIIQTGSIAEGLRQLYTGLNSDSGEIIITNPLDGKDITQNVSDYVVSTLDLWLNFIFDRGGGFPTSAFNPFVWYSRHSDAYPDSFGVQCHAGFCAHRPRDLFYMAHRMLERTAASRNEKLVDSVVFIVPYNTGTGIYVATNNSDNPLKDPGLFFRGFSRRIGSFDAEHKAKNNIPFHSVKG